MQILTTLDGILATKQHFCTVLGDIAIGGEQEEHLNVMIESLCHCVSLATTGL